MARRHYYGDFGDFGAGGRDHIAGPLIGGGIAQTAMLATKLIWPGSKAAKWAGAIGLGVGGLVSGILASRPRFRATGISGLVTAALVGIPRQIEDMLASPGSTAGYLGVITPEQSMGNYFGQQDVELLDSGGGAGVMGVVTAESDGMAGFGQGVPEVELMGGFGANFLSQ